MLIRQGEHRPDKLFEEVTAMSGKTMVAPIGIVSLLLGSPLHANEITISGLVSSGSNMGSIFDDRVAYTYDGATKNLAMLGKNCPVKMGDSNLVQSDLKNRIEFHRNYHCPRTELYWRSSQQTGQCF